MHLSSRFGLYGAETMSCGSGVLVNQPTEPVATVNTSGLPFDDGLTHQLRR
jgi:hypothetical protein